MIILAKAVLGHEFCYNAHSAHAVSKRSASKICDVLNENKYLLKENEIWHIYDVDKYDGGYDFATTQKFTIRNGVVKRIGY